MTKGMDDREKDNQGIGRILSRREVFSLLGGTAGAGVFSSFLQASATPPSCVLKPEQTEGPYFLDGMLNRSDVRSDPSDGTISDGIPLSLTFRVSRFGSQDCSPLAGAVVDLWHCDSRGYYSGVQDRSFNTTGKRFLRGYQVTDNAGMAKFLTIYPGWYPGRTVHIHFKIRTDPSSKAGFEFTSQLYLDDSLTDRVYTLPPYSSRERRMMRNEEDSIFRTGGRQLMLVLDKDGPGYTSTFDIGLQLQRGSP
jgi:protocatechuate 3,4-dioxygenase beta subunit